jgi:hypothetical protein
MWERQIGGIGAGFRNFDFAGFLRAGRGAAARDGTTE